MSNKNVYKIQSVNYKNTVHKGPFKKKTKFDQQPWPSKPPGIECHSSVPFRYNLSLTFDLYRVPPGRGAWFLFSGCWDSVHFYDDILRTCFLARGNCCPFSFCAFCAEIIAAESRLGSPRALHNKCQSLFLGFFFKYGKFDFVTQFLRNGSTKIQSFVYHFVEYLKLLYQNIKTFSLVFTVQSYSWPKWPRYHVVYTRHIGTKGLNTQEMKTNIYYEWQI